MNTPAHAIVNLLLLGRDSRRRLLGPIALGGLLPDVPMFVFYAWEKLIRQTPETIIWSELYYLPGWQAFFDTFNSIPLLLLCGWLAWRTRHRGWFALVASMLLHVCCDLPLHHADAHHHLTPLSDWQFRSPVSYWDPAHHGRVASAIELILTIVASAMIWQRQATTGPRLLIACLLGSYLCYGLYVAIVWL
ncbi:MAG: hypothetical protein O3A51_11040 [Verrucomicrobia bacterium]|nr:hypothetical protein [Verrucomicrobiota bacterium]